MSVGGEETGGMGPGGNISGAGGAERSPMGEALADAVMAKLGQQLPPEQFNLFKEQLDKIPQDEKQGVLASMYQSMLAGEARADRVTDPENPGAPIDEQGAQDVKAAFDQIVPASEMTEQERVTHISALGDLYNTVLSETDPVREDTALTGIADQLTALGLRRSEEGNEETDAKIIQLLPGLTPEQREKVVGKLRVMSDADRQERESVTGEQETQMKSTVSALAQNAHATGEMLDQEIQRQIDELPEKGNGTAEEEARRKLLEKHQKRTASLLGRISDFFGDEQPGRIWTRRMGKGLYFAALAIFIAIVLEMNMINKMSAKKR
ncbi:MAG TPA: hypothetical protein VND99_00450 [Candidatus Acidoferrales bacterium]|nr:hypothetical protein [Candidatus Acidoferrales bacterium]